MAASKDDSLLYLGVGAVALWYFWPQISALIAQGTAAAAAATDSASGGDSASTITSTTAAATPTFTALPAQDPGTQVTEGADGYVYVGGQLYINPTTGQPLLYSTTNTGTSVTPATPVTAATPAASTAPPATAPPPAAPATVAPRTYVALPPKPVSYGSGAAGQVNVTAVPVPRAPLPLNPGTPLKLSGLRKSARWRRAA